MTSDFNRRTFLKAIGAGTAATAAPAILTACATAPAEPAKPIGRVIVIGGGYGGATCAKYIRMWSERRIEVFLIERNAQFVSCPLSNLVLGGSRQIGDLTIGYEKLREYGVQVIRDEVTAIAVDRKRVRLKKIEDLPYDRLVVSPGIDFMYDQIPGLNNPEAQKTILHAWKAGPETVALRKQLEGMRDGGVYILSMPKVPYRCPPGPYERVSQVAALLQDGEAAVEGDHARRQRGHRVEEGPLPRRLERSVQGNHRVPAEPGGEGRRRQGHDRQDGVRLVQGRRAERRAAAARRAWSRSQAKLITANNRWCGVNWQTTESIAVAGHLRPRRRDAVRRGDAEVGQHGQQSRQARGVGDRRDDDGPAAQPDADHQQHLLQLRVRPGGDARRLGAPLEPGEEGARDRSPGSGGVSAQRSEIEKQYADAWARNIWADTLG